MPRFPGGIISNTSPPTALANSVTVDYLVVGGGGGGGTSGGPTGGGGGAGGVLYKTSQSFYKGILYTIVVGAGGVASNAGGSYQGNISYIKNESINANYYAPGGGTGGNGSTSTYTNAKAGGSSGGGGQDNSPVYYGVSCEQWYDNFTVPGTSTYFGNSGGYPYASGNDYRRAGGGGGGKAETGYGGDSSVKGGNGGAGQAYTISGSSVTYACGGGGGAQYDGGPQTPGYGGRGNGTGNGSACNSGGVSSASTNAGANTGDGGGGGARQGEPSNGGSGAVVIRSTSLPASVTGTYVDLSGGGYYIYKFTGSGTITY